MAYEYYINRDQIKGASERIRRAYLLEEVDHPPIIEFSAGSLGYSILEIASDEDKMLRNQLNNISITMQHKTDYCPFLEPWFAVPAYVEPFGVEIKWFENDWPAAKAPLITDNPMAVYDLNPAKVFSTDLWKKIKSAIAHFQTHTNGDIPISTTDPQDPLSMATQIWDTTEFFMALYTNPEEVHFLMNMLTEHFITYYDAQLALIENKAFPGHMFPLGIEGYGISISCDNIVMLSAECYEEFCLPYHSRISEHYNGLFVHSCGKYLHLLPSLLKIPKLRGINYHSSPVEMDPYAVRPIVEGKISTWTDPSLSEVGFDGNIPPFEELYADYFIPGNMCTGPRGLLLSGQGRNFGYAKNVKTMTQSQRYDWIVQEMQKYMKNGM